MASQKLPSETLLVLVGDAVLIEDGLSQRNADLSRFEVIHAPDVIAMSEHPAKAFVKKPASSIAVGFSLLKEGKVQAFSSCGNTGGHQATRKLKVLGLRPYLQLSQVLGETAARQLQREYELQREGPAMGGQPPTETGLGC